MQGIEDLYNPVWYQSNLSNISPTIIWKPWRYKISPVTLRIKSRSFISKPLQGIWWTHTYVQYKRHVPNNYYNIIQKPASSLQTQNCSCDLENWVKVTHEKICDKSLSVVCVVQIWRLSLYLFSSYKHLAVFLAVFVEWHIHSHTCSLGDITADKLTLKCKKNVLHNHALVTREWP